MAKVFIGQTPEPLPIIWNDETVQKLEGGILISKISNVPAGSGKKINRGLAIGFKADGTLAVNYKATAISAANSSAVNIPVRKGHNLAVGDIVMFGGKSMTIQTITTSDPSKDVLGFGTGNNFGKSIAIGDELLQSAAEATTDAEPLVKTPFGFTFNDVKEGEQTFIDVAMSAGGVRLSVPESWKQALNAFWFNPKIA